MFSTRFHSRIKVLQFEQHFRHSNILGFPASFEVHTGEKLYTIPDSDGQNDDDIRDNNDTTNNNRTKGKNVILYR